MISRQHRFHGRASLGFVFRRGITVRGPLFATKAVRNQRQSTYRLAVVVSRRVNKSAVIRNRIRRRLYEACRAYEPQIAGAFDIVITVFNDSIAELPTSQLKSMVRRQLRQAGVFTPQN